MKIQTDVNSQFDNDVKLIAALKNLVKFYNTVVVHPLAHDVNLHQNVLAHGLSTAAFLEDFGGILGAC